MTDRQYKRVRIIVEMDVGDDYPEEVVSLNVANQMQQLCGGKNITAICGELD